MQYLETTKATTNRTTFSSLSVAKELLLWKKTHGPLFWGQIFDNLDVNLQQKLVFINEKLIPE
jgi:hypothetical protein